MPFRKKAGAGSHKRRIRAQLITTIYIHPVFVDRPFALAKAGGSIRRICFAISTLSPTGSAGPIRLIAVLSVALTMPIWKILIFVGMCLHGFGNNIGALENGAHPVHSVVVVGRDRISDLLFLNAEAEATHRIG